jgi:hypothetical protein
MFITALLDPLHHRLSDPRSTPTANYYIHQELANTTKINELMRELKNTQEPSSFSLGLPPASFPLRSAAVARPLSPLWCAAAASAARGSSPPPLPLPAASPQATAARAEKVREPRERERRERWRGSDKADAPAARLDLDRCWFLKTTGTYKKL